MNQTTEAKYVTTCSDDEFNRLVRQSFEDAFPETPFVRTTENRYLGFGALVQRIEVEDWEFVVCRDDERSGKRLGVEVVPINPIGRPEEGMRYLDYHRGDYNRFPLAVLSSASLLREAFDLVAASRGRFHASETSPIVEREDRANGFDLSISRFGCWEVSNERDRLRLRPYSSSMGMIAVRAPSDEHVGELRILEGHLRSMIENPVYRPDAEALEVLNDGYDVMPINEVPHDPQRLAFGLSRGHDFDDRMELLASKLEDLRPRVALTL